MNNWVIIRAGIECLHSSGVRCTVVMDASGQESLKTEVPIGLEPGQWLLNLISEATTILGG